MCQACCESVVGLQGAVMVFYSIEQKIALVEQYICLPHGSKRAWLVAHGISGHMMTHRCRAFSTW